MKRLNWRFFVATVISICHSKNMIIFLYGSDSYRRKRKLDEYIGRYQAKFPGLSLSRFYLDKEGEWERLKSFSASQSLFENIRFGIIFGLEDLDEKNHKEAGKFLKENLKNKDLNLAVISDKKPVKEFNFLLKEPVIVHQFNNQPAAEFQKFLDEEIKNRGLKTDAAAEKLLSQVYANDSWGLVTELDKLALLDNKTITLKVLENNLNVPLLENVFDVIGGIRSSKNISDQLSTLEELFSKNQDPAKIFNIMAVSPYADSGWKRKIADYDAAIKSGKLEYEEVLLDLVIGK